MRASKVWEADNAEYRQESADFLREVFPRGSEVRTIVTHQPRSETPSASIAVLGIHRGEIRNVSHDVARVTGMRYDSAAHGVRVVGGGLNLAHWLVYTLARDLYRDNDDWQRAGDLLKQRAI